VAVGLVLIEHFVHGSNVERLALGGFGVKLFFALSGYLITGVLLDARANPIKMAARNFYWRRFLRLAPALYIAIIGCAALNIADMRQDWWIHGLYLTNVKVAIDNHWGPATHFWSLAVEEQFYFVWFAVVILLPQRALLPSILVGIFLPNAYQVALHMAGAEPAFARVLLLECTDYLCMGALLVYLERNSPKRFCVIMDVLRGPWCLALAASVALIAVLASVNGDPGGTSASLIRFVRMLLTAFLVSHGLSASSSGLFNKVLLFPWVRHMGKISYGIYVYHLFTLPLLADVLHIDAHFGLSGKTGTLIAATIEAIISVSLAQLSWSLVELPLSRFKNLFAGDSVRETGPVVQTV